MTRFPFDLIGFDLDGTLLDTGGDLAAAVNHALGAAGRRGLPEAAIWPMIGGGARRMLARAMDETGGCDETSLDASLAELLAFYEANIATRTRPFPGVVAALDALAARGVRLGVMTNKLERLTMKLLEALGLADRFAGVVGGDTIGRTKPDPAPILEMARRCGGGRAAFVGDSRFDVEGARAAGLPVVVVSFGFRGEPVAALGADAVIDHFDELLPALERVAAR